MEAAGGSLLAAMFAAGLASGVHCVGMCGGIVAAFGTQRVIPVVPAQTPRAASSRQLAFNGGPSRATRWAARSPVSPAAPLPSWRTRCRCRRCSTSSPT
jgi:hypothetical protein